jgi:peptidylprolyl isomerase
VAKSKKRQQPKTVPLKADELSRALETARGGPPPEPPQDEDKRFSMIVLAVVSVVALGGLVALIVQKTGDGEEPSESASIETDEPIEEPSGDPLAAPPDVSAPPANAQRTASGLASRVLRRGTGTEHPGPTSTVVVHYTGWRAENGERFDSSVERGEPATFPLNRVIAGWTEGLQLMVEGEKRRLWIPENLAYQGRPGPPAGMLVFDVELIRIQR